MLKKVTKQFLALFDYDVRRRSRNFVDDFMDQKNLLKKENVKCIFDIGANIGQTAKKYKEIFPSAIIYSFEPTREAFEKLYQSAKDWEVVKPQFVAISNFSGKSKFYAYENNVTNSILPAESKAAEEGLFPGSMKNVECREVSTMTIDDFCLKENIKEIDILKMDIQGGELLALQGARSLLKKEAIHLIYTEVLFTKLYENQAKFYEINKFLDEYGYSLYGIYNFNRTHKGGILSFADAIFISPVMKEKLWEQ